MLRVVWRDIESYKKRSFITRGGYDKDKNFDIIM